MPCCSCSFRPVRVGARRAAGPAGRGRRRHVQLLLLPPRLYTGRPLHHDAAHHLVQVSVGQVHRPLLLEGRQLGLIDICGKGG